MIAFYNFSALRFSQKVGLTLGIPFFGLQRKYMSWWASVQLSSWLHIAEEAVADGGYLHRGWQTRTGSEVDVLTMSAMEADCIVTT